ncbi:MAG TPA: DUF262 domain-containing protein [Anaerolineae bacterium]|nr:DUF262 domain-containing protein [Anaerolineae bacterium]
MDAGSRTIKQIFEPDRRHIVPLYQRPYVWNRDEQWEPFWDDIRDLSDRAAVGGSVRPHFLGAIVLDQLKTVTGAVESRLVIDGQQRLTTLQVFLEACADLSEVHNLPALEKSFRKLTRNDDPLSKDPDEVFKLWPTNTDRQHFRAVMHARTPDALTLASKAEHNDAIRHNQIANAYVYFFTAVNDWLLTDHRDGEELLTNLLNGLRNNVRMVVIDLADDDDAQMIFETLNARGTPLLPADLVKNHLLHLSQLGGEEVDGLYNRYWSAFDTENWRREVVRGRSKRARVDIFLQYYLSLMSADEVLVTHLYKAFQTYVRNKPQLRAVDHLKSLHEYATIFDSFDAMPPGSAERSFFSRINTMEVTTAYPFLLELYRMHKGEDKQIAAVLTDLQSFLVRRMVCQLTAKNYNRFFIDLVATMRSASGSPSEAVRTYLLSSDSDTNRWPDDVEFHAAWLHTPVYNALVRRRLQMILRALEHKLRTPKTEEAPLGSSLTVEHLMPQQWQQHWPLRRGADPVDAAKERSSLIHTIGNLTLLTRILNPAISNGPWSTKLAGINQHSVLLLNRTLPESWDERAIRSRGESLFKQAVKIWPHPGRA